MALSVVPDAKLWSDYFDSGKHKTLPVLGNVDYVYAKELSPLAERIRPARMYESRLEQSEVPARNSLGFHFLFAGGHYMCGCGCEKNTHTTTVERYEWKTRSLTMIPIPLSGAYYGAFMPTTAEVLIQAPDEVKNSQDIFCYTIRNTNKTWFTSREGWRGEYICAYYGAATDWYKI